MLLPSTDRPGQDLVSLLPERVTGNAARLLVDGDAIFDALEAALLEARHTIQLEVFQFGGEVGMRLMRAIRARHEAGVRVRVLLDPAHGHAGSIRDQINRVIREMDDAGIEWRDFDLKRMPNGPTPLANLGLINHAKLVLIDGRVAFTGGMNFYDHGSCNHDYMVRLEGPAAAHLGALMDADWQLSGPPSSPIRHEDGEQAGQAVVEIAETGPERRTIRELITRHVVTAREKVWVEVLFLDDDHIIDTLVEARARGVDVRVVLDPLNWGHHVPELEKLPFHGIPNWHAVDRLTAGGVAVSWFKPSRPGQNLHAKVAMIDDRFLLVGSANYTYRALDRSREVTIGLECPEVARAFAQAFLADEAAATRIMGLTGFQRLLGAAFAGVKHRIYHEARDRWRDPGLQGQDLVTL
ncbi:MAG: Cardiolipin synthetase [Cyanobacteria bacterium RYN_339]|nr:Cardiolipin synthetase [Cyanobacteria bacterium RYN_339]